MIEYVIKMNGDQIEGHPITVDNFKYSLEINDRISLDLVLEKGYAPFHNNSLPSVSIRQKVTDLGYFKDVDGFVKHNYVVEEKTSAELEEVIDLIKEDKKNLIRRIFNKVSNMDVVDGNNVSWNGGFESAIKLDAAKRLSEAAGSDTVVFFDSKNEAHTLSIAEASSVVLLVASTYQTLLAQKQELLNRIALANSVELVDAAVWVGITPSDITA